LPLRAGQRLLALGDPPYDVVGDDQARIVLFAVVDWIGGGDGRAASPDASGE